MKNLFHKLISPNSKEEDSRRHEFILNSLLVSVIFLLSISMILNFVKRLSADFHPEDSIPLSLLIPILILFFSLYILSKKGFFKFSAHIFTGVLVLFTTYMVYLWSVELQAPLLFFSLIIVLSGVLISTRYSFLVSIVCSGILFLGLYLQKLGFYQPNFFWKEKPWGAMEVIVVSVIFLIIATISWLSNRETEKSLKRARRSEKALAKEKDLLEIRVEQRTRELQKAQMEKMASLLKMAEFGNISSGLFHDFVGPLTALSLNIEQLKKTESQKKEMRSNLRQASLATEKMTRLINSFRKQTSDHEIKKFFSINSEIRETIKLLGSQAKNNRVEIIFKRGKPVKTFGNPIKFSQIMTNLISNAVDSYSRKNKAEFKKKVKIELKKQTGNIILKIIDNGQGIPKNIQKKIFDPFFTTKKFGRGTGIGLSLTRNLLEKEFNGKIELKSQKNKGTTFVITFKQTNELGGKSKQK